MLVLMVESGEVWMVFIIRTSSQSRWAQSLSDSHQDNISSHSWSRPGRWSSSSSPPSSSPVSPVMFLLTSAMLCWMRRRGTTVLSRRLENIVITTCNVCSFWKLFNNFYIFHADVNCFSTKQNFVGAKVKWLTIFLHKVILEITKNS